MSNLTDINCSLADFKRKVENAPQMLVLKGYVSGWIDKCLKNNPDNKGVTKTQKGKRAPSAYNIFIGKCMKGCGNDTQPCAERMKSCAVEWKSQKGK